MARKPSVRVVNGYWFSEAGGKGRYYGKVAETSRAEAMARLWATLAGSDGGDGLDRSGVSPDASLTPPGPRKDGVYSPAKGAATARRGGDDTFLPVVPSGTGHQPHSPSSNGSGVSVNSLCDRYLDWVKRHRSEALRRDASLHLRRL
jgi:hypothetical protein